MTTPEHPLLARETAILQNTAHIFEVSSVFREVLNRSVHELERCLKAMERATFANALHHLVTLHLFRQSIVLTDGVDSLLSNVCIDAAAPMLRSSFETNLSLMYVLDGENQRGRALAWYYVTTLDSIRRMRRYAELGVDSGVATGAIISYERLLAKDPLQSIQSEYEDTQAQQNPHRPGRARPKWYSLFGGPRNVEQLVEVVLSGHSLYEVYRILSAVVHGRAGMEQTYEVSQKRFAVNPIRHVPLSHEDPLILIRFVAFLMESTNRMVKRYLPGEQHSEYVAWGSAMLKGME